MTVQLPLQTFQISARTERNVDLRTQRIRSGGAGKGSEGGYVITRNEAPSKQRALSVRDREARTVGVEESVHVVSIGFEFDAAAKQADGDGC